MVDEREIFKCNCSSCYPGIQTSNTRKFAFACELDAIASLGNLSYRSILSTRSGHQHAEWKTSHEYTFLYKQNKKRQLLYCCSYLSSSKDALYTILRYEKEKCNWDLGQLVSTSGYIAFLWQHYASNLKFACRGFISCTLFSNDPFTQNVCHSFNLQLSHT